MIIDVKATRQAPAETDPAQRYLLKSMDKKSRTPLAISLLMAGLVVYLKSFFTGGSQAADGDGPRPAEAGKIDPEPSPQEQALALAALPAPPSPSEADAGDAAHGSGGRIVEELPWARFMQVESPQMGASIEIDASGWIGSKLFGFDSLAANDNATPGFHAPAGPQPQEGPGETGHGPGTTDPDPGSGGPGGPAIDPPEEECSCGGPGQPEGPVCDEDDEEREPNRAPRVSGPVYLLDIAGCAVLLIGLGELLRNAHDPDGDALSVENLTVSHGTLTQAGDEWLFQGGPRLEGQVTITYEITDGALSVAQVAYVTVRRNAVEGSGGDDVILGSMCADEIDGGDGDDNIDARGGDDIVTGGNGDDHIVAGDGDDTVFAGAGNDIVFGGRGDDHISGGDGDDRLYGEDGDDILFGDAGDDLLSGGDGDDILVGGDGDDVLDGGDGDDVLIDGAGRDRTLGGNGDDRIVAALDGEADVHDGGDGHDTLDYSATSRGVTVDLSEGIATGCEIGEDTVTSIEAVIGGSGDDHLIAGPDVAATFTGGAGDDIFEFLPPGEPAPESEPAPLMHTVLDFTVGDRIRMSKYDIFERVLDKFEDRFEEIYGDDFDDDDIAIRYRHDRTDELSRTVVEADFNGDGTWETTVAIEGHRVLVIIEHA